VPLAEIAALLRDPSGARLDAWARRVETDAAQRQHALDEARRLLAIGTRGHPPFTNPHIGEPTMRTFTTVSRTDIGRVRQSNEDVLGTGERLATVADGMGGRPGGEVAAGMAVALVQAGFTGRSLDELQAAVRAANRATWDRGQEHPEVQGMGTTICAAGLTDAGDLAVVNVGDSRAYVLRAGTLTQLTDDHSVTAEAVRRGELTEQEALDHPHHHVLTRAVGIAPDVEVDGRTHTVRDGDRILLCTDGLVNEVTDDEIATALAGDGIEGAADRLVELALARRGRDNVSVVVAEIGA
jgi:serine/threonine protein phosphatase PrpC